MKYKEGSFGRKIESALRRTPDALVVSASSFGKSLFEAIGRPDLVPRNSTYVARVGYEADLRVKSGK